MRLWSLHPRYLDPKGLVALWREALLAQAVIAGQTRGYKHHPQLHRFLESASPEKAIATYLMHVHEEAARRGYNFDVGKIGRTGSIELITVTRGQLEYEWEHLQNKLLVRAPTMLAELEKIKRRESHPLFRIVRGGVAPWERTDPERAEVR